MSENRKLFLSLGKLKTYRVKLVGGPSDGLESICSGDKVISNGAVYIRCVDDDLYYYRPEGAGLN